MTQSSNSRLLVTAIFTLVAAFTAPVSADVFNDLIDIVINDIGAGGGTVAAVEDVMPDPMDLELEHMGPGGFDVDLNPLTGCDFHLTIKHFAPIDGVPIGAFEWIVSDIEMRDENGDVMSSIITDIELPGGGGNVMPTTATARDEGQVAILTGGFDSVSTGAKNDYFIKIAVYGDVNEDCKLNLLDVAPFITILGSGGYSVQADVNQDDAVNLLDIAGFVALLF